VVEELVYEIVNWVENVFLVMEEEVSHSYLVGDTISFQRTKGSISLEMKS
jgi:hypothetical protein